MNASLVTREAAMRISLRRDLLPDANLAMSVSLYQTPYGVVDFDRFARLNSRHHSLPFCPHCKQAILQTSSKNDSGVWSGLNYSRSVATGGSARVATGKRRGGAGADRIGEDLHLRAALSEPQNSGGVHRPDPRTR